MNELKEKIVGIIQESEGEISYPDLYEQLGYQEQRRLLDALRLLKHEGVAQQIVAWNTETKSVSHTVKMVVTEAVN